MSALMKLPTSLERIAAAFSARTRRAAATVAAVAVAAVAAVAAQFSI